MGHFVDGDWREDGDFAEDNGEFIRKPVTFRQRITPQGPFAAEAGRYVLYVSYACPWAHRALIVRALKGLEAAIDVVSVHPEMLHDGWSFLPGKGVDPDPIFGASYLREIYKAVEPRFTGRVTVPVLVDKKTRQIVNNESSEIIRDLNGPMRIHSKTPEQSKWDLYPEALRATIDDINARVYESVNNGVYRCGFARTQAAYDQAFNALFEALDWLEALLSEKRYLAGETFTEADVRLFTTLVRFDPVYVTHFKCNRQRIADYPNLSGYLREVYQMPGIAATCDFQHIKSHYFGSHRQLNPTGVIPRGPLIDLDQPHGRG